MRQKRVHVFDSRLGVWRISLGHGKWAVVDAADYAAVKAAGLNWYCKRGYAARKDTPTGPCIFMHHVVLPRRAGREVDHRDRNPLNNRRGNLRYATYSQQAFNRSKRSDNTWGFHGVVRREGRTAVRFRATLMVRGKREHLGYFATAVEAARAYDAAARKRFGAFAVLNFSNAKACR